MNLVTVAVADGVKGIPAGTGESISAYFFFRFVALGFNDCT
jgi:hypothetical protein